LEKVRAMLWPASEDVKCAGREEDFAAVLCLEALRTRAVSSWGERSAIERKWRGANGEVCGVPDAETL
jgi:hypothetical protein